jgi:hypothetical protein
MLRCVFLVVVVACSSTPLYTVTLVNRTDRPIEEVYVYPAGSQNHGKSRATLAPDASVAVKIARGHVDVLAVSAKVQLDDKTRERRTASQTLELRGPVELVFHDSDKVPAGLGRKDTFGVPFHVERSSAAY